MKTNVGSTDRVLRIVIGIGLLSLLYFVEGAAKWWGLVGLVPLLTGVFGTCPMYSIFGLSTCPMEKKGT
ncbi:MAG TPA: DUF2892 domain-containing protein [Burkholderiales bacterium]|nr:DUF2892 domain-containing protein [Burkholderiales bacterium]